MFKNNTGSDFQKQFSKTIQEAIFKNGTRSDSKNITGGYFQKNNTGSDCHKTTLGVRFKKKAQEVIFKN